MEKKEKDIYSFSRLMYVIEAALEYFISIAVGTVYLARLTKFIGMSDALTGVLSSFVSLGCGFQLIAIFLSNKKPVKRWVTWLHLISQLTFSFIYIVPVIKISKTVKTVIFIVMLLSAQIIHNVINSPKINWFMSLVDDKKRGRFTANKEIVSLLGGIVFSYFLGLLIDHYNVNGQIQTSFIICGIGLTILTVFHTLTLIFSKEKNDEGQIHISSTANLKNLLKDKTLFKIVIVSVFWSVANYVTTSFSGAYQANELAFSTTFSSVIIMIGSLIRAFVSRPIGKFADKYSFKKMLILCYVVECFAFLVYSFITPSNAKILYFVYYILYCVGMGGINSATINLIYDYVDHSQRTNALAIQHTFSGFAGFFVVLIVSPLVSYIKNNGNSIFGISIYAQQFMAIISFIVLIFAIIYLQMVIKNVKKAND